MNLGHVRVSTGEPVPALLPNARYHGSYAQVASNTAFGRAAPEPRR